MHRRRFFLTAPFAGGTVPFEVRDLHHLRDVLRVEAGDVVEAVTPEGVVIDVRIESMGPREAKGVAVTCHRPDGAAHLPLVLCQAVSKGKKMDLMVRKATEMGVDSIVAFESARSVVKLDGKLGERRERWARVAEEAAKQSGRSRVPGVDVVRSVDGIRPVLDGADRAVVLWEGATTPLRAALSGLGSTDLVMVVGPEGGFDKAEIEAMEVWGAMRASLGPHVLRSETAAIAATAIAAYECGWLGGERR